MSFSKDRSQTTTEQEKTGVCRERGGGSPVGLFVTFLYASPAHEVQGCWDLCVYETDCALVRVCMCACVQGRGGGSKRMWRRTQMLTHHPLHHPIINRSLLAAQYLLNTQTFQQLYQTHQTKPSLLTQITSRCSSKPSL